MKFIIAVVGLVLGFGLGFSARSFMAVRPGTKDHWETIHRYNAYLADPSHDRNGTGTGLSSLTPPSDPEPSLAALVAAGELGHVDLVLPTVPSGREASQHWMKYAQSHREIVFITGNPSYTAFRLRGQQPLHLNIWFRDADQSVVQDLIAELEGKAAEWRPQHQRTEVP